ncbi:DUF3268 family zinc-finger domain-containing protein [Enterococcus faecium]|nr:DUF3268 family zinc-finger domain-containing protein [Enterococcus faecium]
MSKVLVPDNCPYCGANVIWASNEILYGKVYGNGKCYYCTGCGASVGAHTNRPKEPLGILATPPMKRWKKLCHSLFDPVWKSRQIIRGSCTVCYPVSLVFLKRTVILDISMKNN